MAGFSNLFASPMRTFCKQLSFVVLVSIATTLPIAAAHASESIGINFIGSLEKWGAVMTPEDKGGLPSVAQTNWNNAAKPFGVIDKLINSAGKSTTANVIWHGGLGTHGIDIEDKGDNSRMMRGYLDAGAGEESSTVTFTGVPYAWYDVIVYFDGDTNNRDRVSAYTVNGVMVYGKDVTDFNGSFTEVEATDPEKVTPGNYVRFTGLVGSSFSVRAEGISAPDEYLRAPINAIQIVRVSDPSSFNPIPDNETKTVRFVSKP
jgi:hypothetical protein